MHSGRLKEDFVACEAPSGRWFLPFSSKLWTINILMLRAALELPSYIISFCLKGSPCRKIEYKMYTYFMPSDFQ